MSLILYSYRTFPAFPIVFQGVSLCTNLHVPGPQTNPTPLTQLKGWSPVIGSLPYLAVLMGTCLSAATNMLNQKRFIAALKANKGRPVPEARLPPMMIGAPLFAAGLFIFGWTSRVDVH